jgi:rhodanese-related sulfurtransferase
MSQIRIMSRTRVLKASLVGLIGLACLVGVGLAEELPAAKQTHLGLYVTAEEAYEKWRADPDSVKVLDVRTVEEYVFVGHAPMAWNIPFTFQTHEWNEAGTRLTMRPNPDFVALVKGWAEPSETILVMCRSGGRSALAVDALAQAGYTHVYSIVDGMEGDTVKDPDSPDYGKRTKNGWKNAGLPWTYDLDRAHVRIRP